MKSILTLVKAGIRHGKAGLISILVLFMVVTLSLTAVVTINQNTSKHDAEAMRQVGYGDFMACVVDRSIKKNGTTNEELTKKLNHCKEIDKVEKYDYLCASIVDKNDKNNGNDVIVFPFQTCRLKFRVFNKREKEVLRADIHLKKDEIIVPSSYKTIFGIDIGDKLYMNTNDGKRGFTIAYFFEDPFMGSAFMGIKTVMMADEVYQGIQKEALTILDGNLDTQEAVLTGTMYNLFQTKDSELSSLKWQRAVNKQSSLFGFAWVALSAKQAQSYMLSITNIFSGILIAFIIVLVLVALIIIGHSISSQIEQEYVNIGILKAVGLNQSQLKLVLTIQYLMAAVFGTLLGIPVAVPIVQEVNNLIRPITGLYTSNQLQIGLCTLFMMVILVFVWLYIRIKLRKLGRITPVRAISGGREVVYFSSWLHRPLRKKGLNFGMAFRQITSGLKQYQNTCLITMLLVFFLILSTMLTSWIGSDGENLKNMFKCFDYDLSVRLQDVNQKTIDEIDTKIHAIGKVESKYHLSTKYMMLDDCLMFCYVCDQPKENKNLLEGRICKYENEILITPFVQEDLGLKIGDSVQVGIGDKRRDFIICGLYQSANDMGKNFMMSMQGYEKLIGETCQSYDIRYRFEDSKLESANLTEKLQDGYNVDEVTITSESFSSIDIESMLTAIRGIGILIYVISVVFAIIVIFIVCGRIFIRERTDYGIYKAIGFTSQRLRSQFSIRFGIVALAGSLLGIVMTMFLSDWCITILIRAIGFSKVDAAIEPITVLIPVIFMTVVFTVFAYLLSYKIKRVKTRVLITE